MATFLLVVGVVVGIAFIYHRVVVKGQRCKSKAKLHGKTVIVTGSNTGIGKMTALDLARRGARVILACRNKPRAEAALADIKRESGSNEVVFMHLDLGSLKSVRSFAETFLKNEPRLDLLINNAGAINSELSRDINKVAMMLMKPFFMLFFKDTVAGSQTTLHCALQEGLEPLSGRYFSNCTVRNLYPKARDDAVAKKLWEVSERLSGISS